MSAIGKFIGDTGSIGKNVFNIVLVVIVLFVAKHFLSDFGLKMYKMYYGVEGMTTAGAAGDYKMVTQGRGGGNLLTESECKSYAEANKYGYGINNNNPIGCIKTGNEVRFSSGSKNYKCSSANVCVEKPFIDGYTLVNSGKPAMNVSEEECKNLTNKLQGYTFSKISEQGNPNGCMLQNGVSPGAKGIYYNSAGTADCGAFDGVSQCIEKLASSQTVASAAPVAPAAQAPQEAEAEAKVADAATQASQMHSDAQDATNETSISPGAAIGTWGGNQDSGIPDGSVAAQAASSNLATQQIIPGTAYPSNTTVANVSGVYPTPDSLNNIQGGNVPQSMAGVNTEMAPSPLAPTSSEVASKANDAISRNIRGRDEEDAAIDISINMKMSEHVAKNLVGSVPQYTVPQQYATGRTTGLDNNTYNPSYQAMPQESLGTTYDNRLGGNYPTYSYNTQNNTGTAYTNQYKPVNPDKKPTPYNSLMDLFR